MAVMFASVFLLDAGLTNAQIGMLVATVGAVSAVAQPVVAGMAERSLRVPLRAWIAGAALLMALLAVALLVPGATIPVTALLFGLLMVTAQSTQPLVNSIGMAAINDGHPVDFGIARATGSGAFALLSVAAGGVIALAGARTIPITLLAITALLAAAAWTFVFPAAHVPEPSVAVSAAPAPAALTPRRRRRFTLVIVALTLGMFSHNLVNTYIFQIISSHGGGSAEMGVAVMIAAVVEIPTLVLWSHMARRWSAGTLLVVSSIGFAGKSAATLAAPGVIGIYMAQGLQFFAFALMVPASIYYVNALLPAGERIRGQAYVTMTFTLAAVGGGLSGGILIDTAGVPAMLMVGTAVGVLGVPLMLLATERGLVTTPTSRG